jgi:hypothetical protein
MYLASVDFKQAFNSLVRDVIRQVLDEYKVPKKNVNMIKGINYLYCCTVHFEDSLNISHQQMHQLYII